VTSSKLRQYQAAHSAALLLLASSTFKPALSGSGLDLGPVLESLFWVPMGSLGSKFLKKENWNWTYKWPPAAGSGFAS
jgi:hypothetical protein